MMDFLFWLKFVDKNIRCIKTDIFIGPGVVDPTGIEPVISSVDLDEVTITSTDPRKIPRDKNKKLPTDIQGSFLWH